MSYAKPTGHETEAPPGLDRYESMTWWSAHKLARAAEANATGLGAVAFDHFIIHPTKPCTCDHGTRLEGGALKTCDDCKGLSYLRMTLEEIRTEYRAIRTRVVDDNPRVTEEDFHEATRQWITKQGHGRDTPGYYLAAARAVETKYQLERAARRSATRSRW